MLNLIFVAILLVSGCCVETVRINKRQSASNLKTSINEDKLSKTIHQLLDTLEENDSASFHFNHKLITISSESKDEFIKELKKHKEENRKAHARDGNDKSKFNPGNMDEQQFLNFLTRFDEKSRNGQLQNKQKNEKIVAMTPRPHPTLYIDEKMLHKNVKSAEYNNNYDKTHLLPKNRQKYNHFTDISKEPHSKNVNYEKNNIKYTDYSNYNRLNVDKNDNKKPQYESLPRNVNFNQNMLSKSSKYPDFNSFNKLEPKDNRNTYHKIKEFSRNNPPESYYNQKVIQRNLQSSEFTDDYNKFNGVNNNKNINIKIKESPTESSTQKELFQKIIHKNTESSELNDYVGVNPEQSNTNYYNQVTEATTEHIFSEVQGDPSKSLEPSNYGAANPVEKTSNSYNQMYYYNPMDSYGRYPRAKRDVTQIKEAPNKVDMHKIEDIVAASIFNDSSIVFFDYNEDVDENGASKNDCPKFKQGEKEISINDAPYHVAYGRKCSGAIIHRKWVLTAAHCKKEGHIMFGSGDLESSQPMKIARHHVHPNWKRNHKTHPFDYNFQLLELKKNLPFSTSFDHTQAILLGTGDLEVGKNVSVVGWAVMKEDEKYPYMLRDFTAPIVDKKFCNNRNDLEYHGDLTENMFCVGYEEGDSCGCQDDPGNPAVLDGRLVGLASFGRRCSTANSYGVYSNVSAVRDWIQKTVGTA